MQTRSRKYCRSVVGESVGKINKMANYVFPLVQNLN